MYSQFLPDQLRIRKTYDKLPGTTARAKQIFKVSLENMFRIARQNLFQLLVDEGIPGSSFNDEQAI
jgi:hypothetical protein